MEKLAQDAQTLFNVHLTGRQVMALVTYEKELLEWNQKFNLTAIRDVESIRTKHFLDSFSCVAGMEGFAAKSASSTWGPAQAFRAFPLKILYPNLKLTLVESVGKKAMFCQHIVRVLGLEHVDVIQSRRRRFRTRCESSRKYDWAVARAVANLNVLGEYLIPLVRVGGTMLAQKGESGPAEAQSAEGAMKLFGGKLKQLIPVHLPGVADDRYLILMDKVAATPPKYPRKPGIPAKQPL